MKKRPITVMDDKWWSEVIADAEKMRREFEIKDDPYWRVKTHPLKRVMFWYGRSPTEDFCKRNWNRPGGKGPVKW